MAAPSMRTIVENGKYTYWFDKHTGKAVVLRYDVPWRECTGDKLLLAMAQEIERLREKLAAFEKAGK